MAIEDSVLVQLGGGPGEPFITIRITDLGDGNFKFEVTQEPGEGGVVGDLRGVFFDVGGGFDDDLATVTGGKKPTTTLNVSATGDDVTKFLAGDDNVTDLGNGANMNGATSFNDTSAEGKGYDVGVAFGTAGIGKDDIRSTSFTFDGLGGMTLADFVGMDFGVRLTSVGTEGGLRDGSLKLTSSSFQPIADGDEDIDCVIETDSAEGNVFQAEIEGAGGVTLTQTLTSFTLYDEDGGIVGSSAIDGFGVAIPLPNTEGATITFNADGSYTINSGGDELNADDHLPFTLSYTVHQTYTDVNGHVIGELDDTSELAFDICGENDDPDAANDNAGCIVEGGSASGNVILGTIDVGGEGAAGGADSDIDRGDVLTVTKVTFMGTDYALGDDDSVTIDLNGDDDGGATLTMNADGTWSFATNGMYDDLLTGQDIDLSFTYTVEDGNGGTASADLLLCVKGEGTQGGGGTLEPPPNPASALSHGYWKEHAFSDSEGFAGAVGNTTFDDFFNIDDPNETTWTDWDGTTTGTGRDKVPVNPVLTDLSFLGAIDFGNGQGSSGDTMTPNPGTGYEGLVREATTAVLNFYDEQSSASFVEWYIYERNLNDNDANALNNPTDAASVLADLKAQVEATIEGAAGAYTVTELESLLQATHH